MAYFNLLKNIFTIAKTTAAIKAVVKLSTLKPWTKLLISIRRNALITKVKSPKVIIFTGKVKITKIGFNTIVNIPQTTEITSSVIHPEIVIPGTKYAVM